MTAQAALHAAQIAFIGPVLGSLARPVGGWLADRIGGRGSPSTRSPP